MKYYNPSNNFKAPIPREPKPYSPPRQANAEVVIPKLPEKAKEAEKEEPKELCQKEEKLSFSTDDVIILGLILVLLGNGCEDYLLLALLGYLLLVK